MSDDILISCPARLQLDQQDSDVAVNLIAFVSDAFVGPSFNQTCKKKRYIIRNIFCLQSLFLNDVMMSQHKIGECCSLNKLSLQFKLFKKSADLRS